MKKRFTAAIFIVLTAAIFTITGFTRIKKTDVNAPAKGFAVIELFTSEGCSSCPAADETVARLLSKKIDNVFILAYHVDYWNRLGWKDAFSSAAFSERQNQYATVFNNGSVYTPQVVVNGLSEFVGSDEMKLRSTVEEDLHKQPALQLKISASKVDDQLTVSYKINSNEPLLLNIALVQSQASTNVKRGENGGRTLHHVNIVRELKTIDASGNGIVTIQLPQELKSMPLEIIAYAQNKKSLEILSADQTSF